MKNNDDNDSRLYRNPLIPLGALFEAQCDEALKRLRISSDVASYVKSRLKGESTGHDWWHALRVSKLAKHIAYHEDADMHVAELAALLHDIADWKFTGGDETVGPSLAKECLFKAGADNQVISHVCEIIRTISFKGARVRSQMTTIEGKVVQDADRLDAIGAIGIARAFAYGGARGREIYNPEISPEMHDSFEKYKNSKGPTFNHFHEKLFLLKDLMNTETARNMAESRHRILREYLDQFKKEWDGLDYEHE